VQCACDNVHGQIDNPCYEYMIEYATCAANDAKKAIACLLTASAASVCTQRSLLVHVERE